MFIKIILACSFMFDSSAAAISGAPDFLTHLSAPQTPTVVAVARSLPVLETPLPAIEGIVTGALNLPTILPQTKARAEASEVV
jgi:hypothetical protein